VRAAVYYRTRDVWVEDVPDATLREPTDALIRVTHAATRRRDLREMFLYRVKRYGAASRRPVRAGWWRRSRVRRSA